MAVPFEIIIEIIEKIFPPACAYEWDNSGIQLHVSDEVSGVLCALDLSSEIVDEAIEKECNLIVTHHPALFHSVKSLSVSDPVTGAVLKAARAGINIYSAHTSCDCAPDGLNFALAKAVGLRECCIFAEDGCKYPGGGLGAVGKFASPLTGYEIIEKIKKALDAKAVRCSGVAGTYDRMAVIGGAAGEFYKEAGKQNIGVLLVGEARHNELIEAYASNVLLIAAGHFETERIFTDLAEKKISDSLLNKGFSLRVEAAQKGNRLSFVK